MTQAADPYLGLSINGPPPVAAPAQPDAQAAQSDTTPQPAPDDKSDPYLGQFVQGSQAHFEAIKPALEAHAASEAATAIQQAEDAGKTLNPSEKFAILDAHRQDVGLPSVQESGDQFYNRVAQTSAKDNSFMQNLGPEAAAGYSTLDTAVTGIFSPKTAKWMQDNVKYTFGAPQEGSYGNVAGQGIGLAANFAAIASSGPAATLLMGAQAAGDVRIEVAKLRDSGQQVSLAQEALYATTAAVIQAGLGHVLGEAAGGQVPLQSVLRALSPELLASVQGTDGAVLRPILQRAFLNAGVGASTNDVLMASQEIAKKLEGINKGDWKSVWDGIQQQLPRSTLVGALGQAGAGGLGEVSSGRFGKVEKGEPAAPETPQAASATPAPANEVAPSDASTSPEGQTPLKTPPSESAASPSALENVPTETNATPEAIKAQTEALRQQREALQSQADKVEASKQEALKDNAAAPSESAQGKLPNETDLATGEVPRGTSAEAPVGPAKAPKEELKARAAALPDGTLIHGTDLSSLPGIAVDGVQPGKSYGQGGRSDENVVYGSQVEGGEPGLAVSYSGRGHGTPVFIELKPNVETESTSPGAVAMHSPGKSYVRPEDIAAVHIPGQPPMSLSEAVQFAKGEPNAVPIEKTGSVGAHAGGDQGAGGNGESGGVGPREQGAEPAGALDQGAVRRGKSEGGAAAQHQESAKLDEGVKRGSLKKAAALPRARKASDLLLDLAKSDNIIPGDEERANAPGLHKDVVEGASRSQRQTLAENMRGGEDRESDATAGMNAAQKAAYEKSIVDRFGANREENLSTAIEHYKNSPDANARLLAVQAEAEGQGPSMKVKPKTFNNGDRFKIGDRPFRVEVDKDGNMHFVDDDVTIPYVDPNQPVKIAKGSIERASEQKTTGPQGSLLGERHEGSGIGSKTGGMFGDTSRGGANPLEEQLQREAADQKKQGEHTGSLLPKPEPFAETKAALKKMNDFLGGKGKKGTTLGSGLGGASDFFEHATDLAVALIKDLAAVGKHGFEHFVKAVSDQVGNPRVRAFMLRGEKGEGGARALYNAARAHSDITAHGLENTMTPEAELPAKQSDINAIAKMTPEKIAARAAERAAARAAPPVSPTEAQTLREATIKPAETVKGTINRNVNQGGRPKPRVDEEMPLMTSNPEALPAGTIHDSPGIFRPGAEEPTVTEREALQASQRAASKGAATGFKAGQETETPAQANRRVFNTIAPPEDSVAVGKAIRASMTIRAKGEAAVAKLESKAATAQNVRDAITEAAKDLPNDLRGQFNVAIRDAKTPNDFRKTMDRMQDAVSVYELRNSWATAKRAIEDANLTRMDPENRALARGAIARLKDLGDHLVRASEERWQVQDRQKEIEGMTKQLADAATDAKAARVAQATNELANGVPKTPEPPKDSFAARAMNVIKGIPGDLKGVRERYAGVATRFGDEAMQSVVNLATAAKQRDGMVQRFLSENLTGDTPKETDRLQRGFLALGYHNTAEALRADGKDPSGIPDIGIPKANNRAADPQILKAAKRWQAEIEPELARIRKEQGLPVDDFAKRDPAFFRLNLTPVKNAPRSLGLFGNDTSMKTVYDQESFGTGEYVTEPGDALRSIVGKHLYMEAFGKANDAVEKLAVKPSDVYQRDGMDVAKIKGREIPVREFTVPDPSGNGVLSRYVPKELFDAYRSVLGDSRQPGAESLIEKAINLSVKGQLLFGSDVGPHVLRELSNVSGRIAQSGRSVLSAIPWLGSRVEAIRGLREMATKPIGDVMKILNERAGSDRGLGIFTSASEETPSLLHTLTNFGHSLLFGEKKGFDVLARSEVARSHLYSLLGPDGMEEMQSRLKSSSPTAVARWVEGKIGAGGMLALGREVNNTLGYSNRILRADWINKAQLVDPFIGAQAGMIPHELGRYLTANISPTKVFAAAKRGDYRQAATMLAGSIMTGVVGTYVAKNTLNYAMSGHFMSDNDKDRKTDVSLGPIGYWTNFDPAEARASRMLGVDDFMQHHTLGALAGGMGRGFTNEALSTLFGNNLSRQAFAGLTGMAKFGSRVPYITEDGDLMRTPPGSFYPFGAGAIIAQEIAKAEAGKPTNFGRALLREALSKIGVTTSAKEAH